MLPSALHVDDVQLSIAALGARVMLSLYTMLCEYATRSLSRCREGEQLDKFDKFEKVQSPGGIYTCWESNPGCPTREAGALPGALHVDDALLGSSE